MPYFIELDTRTIVVRPPGSIAGPGQVVVDGETAAACDLVHGQQLSGAQVQALRDGSAEAFRAVTQPESREPVQPRSVPVANGAAASSPAAQRANGVAKVVEVACWIVLVLSVLGGLIVATTSRVDPFSFETEHPYVGLGIAIAVGGAFQALVVIMIACYIQARTEGAPTG